MSHAYYSRSGHNSGKLSKLFTEPLTLWTSAASKLRDHKEKSKLHQWSVLEPLRQNLEIVSLCKILQFLLLNFD